MLGQRRRRWASINPVLVQRLVSAGAVPIISVGPCRKGLIAHVTLADGPP